MEKLDHQNKSGDDGHRDIRVPTTSLFLGLEPESSSVVPTSRMVANSTTHPRATYKAGSRVKHGITIRGEIKNRINFFMRRLGIATTKNEHLPTKVGTSFVVSKCDHLKSVFG